MNIIVDWGDADETLWIWRFVGTWTANDFKQALHTAQTAFVSKTHPIDVIVDIRQSQAVPKNLLALVRIGIQPIYHHNGSAIIVTESRFWKKIHDLAVSLFFEGKPTGIHFVRTIDQAYDLLGNIRYQRRRRGFSS